MIHKFIKQVFRLKNKKPQIIPREIHRIERDHISRCALKVAQTLREGGFSAYIVGGAVRDLMLGIKPKDFDVATNAKPEEAKRLFRRSRIIGRRFRLVQAICGTEVVEVATFRSKNVGTDETDEHGRVLSDNVYGSHEEDAARRDFTINALYYDPHNQTIVDFQGGVADLKKKILRIIGDPATRYREDPIRMLRAVRLAAKLGMKIEESTRKPIRTLAPLIQNVPPSRLFDEMLKLLLSGHSHACVKRLHTEGLHHGILPLLDTILEQPEGERFITQALEQTDQRIQSDKSISTGFLFAALLWQQVLVAWKALQEKGVKPIPALFQAMDPVLDVQLEKLAIPRRYRTDMKEIWSLQARFENRAGRRAFRLLEHPRFRAGFDFLLLRCQSHEAPEELGKWWDAFQHANNEKRELMVNQLHPGPRRIKSKVKHETQQAELPLERVNEVEE